MIKGILLDYGGTIDTNGLHWANVLWDSYQKHDVKVNRDAFSKAYSFGERALAIHPIIKKEHLFFDVLFLKITQQFHFLKEQGFMLDEKHIERIATDCNQFAFETVENAAVVLADLASLYPLILVSNFYGNINHVLSDFGISRYFQHVVESAVVGVRKPDPQIYQLGIDLLGFKPDECVVIGDSYSKDIVPAKTLGCKAIWLNVKGWEDNSHETQVFENCIEIADFSQVTPALEQLG